MLDFRDPSLLANAIRDALGLAPHPEDGHYRELWREQPASGCRGVGTSILFLLAAGEQSHWQRVNAAEIWLWHAGAPLLLGIASDSGPQQLRLGPDLAAGETLQAVVPARARQDTASFGAWSLVSCVVAPAFEFAGFEMAPPDWSPPAG